MSNATAEGVARRFCVWLQPLWLPLVLEFSRCGPFCRVSLVRCGPSSLYVAFGSGSSRTRTIPAWLGERDWDLWKASPTVDFDWLSSGLSGLWVLVTFLTPYLLYLVVLWTFPAVGCCFVVCRVDLLGPLQSGGRPLWH